MQLTWRWWVYMYTRKYNVLYLLYTKKVQCTIFIFALSKWSIFAVADDKQRYYSILNCAMSSFLPHIKMILQRLKMSVIHVYFYWTGSNSLYLNVYRFKNHSICTQSPFITAGHRTIAICWVIHSSLAGLHSPALRHITFCSQQDSPE